MRYLQQHMSMHLKLGPKGRCWSRALRAYLERPDLVTTEVVIPGARAHLSHKEADVVGPHCVRHDVRHWHVVWLHRHGLCTAGQQLHIQPRSSATDLNGALTERCPAGVVAGGEHVAAVPQHCASGGCLLPAQPPSLVRLCKGQLAGTLGAETHGISMSIAESSAEAGAWA